MPLRAPLRGLARWSQNDALGRLTRMIRKAPRLTELLCHCELREAKT